MWKIINQLSQVKLLVISNVNEILYLMWGIKKDSESELLQTIWQKMKCAGKIDYLSILLNRVHQAMT